MSKTQGDPLLARAYDLARRVQAALGKLPAAGVGSLSDLKPLFDLLAEAHRLQLEIRMENLRTNELDREGL